VIPQNFEDPLVHFLWLYLENGFAQFQLQEFGVVFVLLLKLLCDQGSCQAGLDFAL
jgi:hypothetical protein